MPSDRRDFIDEDVRLILERLKGAGLNQAIALDLTSEELGIPVIRMIIPKTEYLHSEPGEPLLGARAKKMLEDRVERYKELTYSTM